jgi:LRR receptor-like serine/threonine-protein kinase FLS2
MVALSFILAFAARAVWRRHRTVRANLELQTLLLEESEGEVAALRRAWEIPHADIHLQARIDGESPGAFGEVWRAEWDGIAVAVKMLQKSVMTLDVEALEEFHKEVEFMQRTRHPNIVRFFGAGTWTDGVPFLVVELVARGTLKSLLRGKGDETPHLPWSLKGSLGLDIARGMAYIHSINQIHRDLKSGNVLITEQNRAKISDFGTVRLLRSGRPGKSDTSFSLSVAAWPNYPGAAELSMELTAGKGTPLYMSPEVIRGSAYGSSADVWSYGILLWELMAQRAPDLLEQEGRTKGPMLSNLLSLLDSGKRLSADPSWPSSWSQLVSMCTHQDPSSRPSFEEICSVMERGAQAHDA